jgi:starch-binding outer membrane protein, SusD/RagB family
MKMSARTSRLGLAGLLVLLLGLGTGCSDFLEVTNPGPLTDEQLNDPAAMAGLVTGMSADLSFGLSRAAFVVSLAAGEQNHGGSYLWAGQASRGLITDAMEEAPHVWGFMHRARWVAEAGLDRMQEVMGGDFTSSPLSARAYLLAGYSNRLLGETVCDAVFDGQAPVDFSQHFDRAEAHFTESIGIAQAAGASTLETSARAGRATVRAALGDWSGAVSDAAQVPTDFQYDAIFSLNTTREYNYVYSETGNRLEASVFNTDWEEVFDDPRVPWDTIYDSGGGLRVGQDGLTPHFQQGKYPGWDENIPLVKGAEMRMIEAEAQLRAGNVDEAFNLVNEQRAHFGLPALETPGEADAWDALQQEYQSVVWLEGRNLWNLRRWHSEGLNDFLSGREHCIPISREERQSNENIS